MFHFDPNDELCPFYLQNEDSVIKYNNGFGHMKNYNGKSVNKIVNATSA